MNKITRITAAGAAAAFALAVLTGCGAAAGPQSAADACKIVSEGMANVQSEFTDMATTMQGGDVSTLGDTFAKLASTLDELGGKVTNEEVGAAVTEMKDGVEAFSEAVKGAKTLTDITDVEAMTEASTKIQSATTSFAELCS